MFRKCAIALSIVLLVFTTACSAKSSSASSGSPAAVAVAASAGASAGECPTHDTRAFAKTRFVADAGLAAGAFKRWIYTPYEHGAFKKGADGRVKAIAKAAAAGAFVVSRLLAAKKNAQANPTLCRIAVAPITRLTNSIKGLVTRSRNGDLNASDVKASDGSFDQFRSSASSVGAAYKEQNTSIPGLG